MAETSAKILTAPKLPSVVKGDGRYLMSMLKDFLEQTAKEVNFANGFSADEMDAAGSGAIAAPRNFFLTFNRLGGTLSWTHIPDIDKLAYYETRTNTNVGSSAGLLEQTIDNSSMKLPLSYVGRVYLFAVMRDGTVSSGAQINYTKARPTAPTDLALTKDQQGTLISFLAIPTDCMGANIYVNDVLYQSTDNIYLYTGEDSIKQVSVAYYDQFGEGERETIYCVLPDVTNFIVERNDTQLYFYWDAMNIKGVHYVVKVGATADWNKALTIFDTANNKYRYIYPNTGSYYMMIKAVDEHNNYSENAVYAYITNEVDEHKNVIIELDQESVAYNGVKNNLYYDAAAQELKLEKEATFGEYIVDVTLPQVYRARNWYEYVVIGETESSILWDDMDWLFDSSEADKTLWNGTLGDLVGVSVTQEIARYTGNRDNEYIDIIGLNKTLTTDKKLEPTVSNSANDYRDGRWHTGLYISDFTQLAYSIEVPKIFALSFNIKVTSGLGDTLLLTLKGADGYLILGYDSDVNKLFLRGSDNVTVYTSELPIAGKRDWLTIALSQGESERRLFANSMNYDQIYSGTELASPIGAMSELYLYPMF